MANESEPRPLVKEMVVDILRDLHRRTGKPPQPLADPSVRRWGHCFGVDGVFTMKGAAEFLDASVTTVATRGRGLHSDQALDPWQPVEPASRLPSVNDELRQSMMIEAHDDVDIAGDAAARLAVAREAFPPDWETKAVRVARWASRRRRRDEFDVTSILPMTLWRAMTSERMAAGVRDVEAYRFS